MLVCLIRRNSVVLMVVEVLPANLGIMVKKDYEEHRGRFKASHPRKIHRKRPLNTDNTNQACTADPSAVQVWYSIVTH